MLRVLNETSMDIYHHTIKRPSVRAGFTLVESLIGIAILVMAVLAPLAIAQSSIQGARYAQQQTTAMFLAQEGVELVKYQIYRNMNTGNGWLAGIDCGTVDCEIVAPRNSANGLIQQCTGSGNNRCRVYMDPNTNLYQSQPAGAAANTPFRRVIRLQNPGPWEAKVVVTVLWNAPNGTSRTYTLEDYVYRWR